MKLRSAILLLALATSACAGSSPGSDAGSDAGVIDAGPVDAGVADAGPLDAGEPDAGPADAGPADAGQAECIPGGDGGYIHAPYASISQYCLISLADDGGIAFDSSVTPYDLNTPLFSDYALKVRGVWMPAGTSALYDDTNAFSFPTGTVLIKSFGLRDDSRTPDVRWVETRLLINTGDAGWKGYGYLWNDAGNDAAISYGGGAVPLTWISADGGTVQDAEGGTAYYFDADGGTVKYADGGTNFYPVPSYGQCQQCHESNSIMTPIGPKARELNKNFAYASGSENELTHWTNAGILTGAPADPTQAPKLPVWNDPSTGTVEQRARAYLEANCAHCHNTGGYAHTTGLFLWASETDPTTYGICKAPVAAGPATGGNAFDVVPGDPLHSIMIYRMTSTSPGVMMPLIGRSVVDEEGLGLLNSWITSLDGGCP